MAKKIYASVLIILGAAAIIGGAFYFVYCDSENELEERQFVETEAITEDGTTEISVEVPDTVTIVMEDGTEETAAITPEDFKEDVEIGALVQDEDGNWYYPSFADPEEENPYEGEYYIPDNQKTKVVDEYYTDDRKNLSGVAD